MRKVVLFVCVVASCFARDFTQHRDYVAGAYMRVGAEMGVGLEFGFPILKGELLEWRNFVGIESFGMKIQDSSFDTATLLFHEKMTLSYLTGSSVASAIGISYFRPYLFLGGGFGLLGGKYNNFGSAPYLGEINAGLGHEFITKGGHAFFFEFGGGALFLKDTRGITKVLLGYRFYF